ncbi:hypothetical protein SXCC_02494 [Gluconacetobacter sp. SXCC-1]|nr:hypothetical protein SXCC_02494 [Gluconacetobacter sp. SXCC-1]
MGHPPPCVWPAAMRDMPQFVPSWPPRSRWRGQPRHPCRPPRGLAAWGRA